MDIPRPVRLVA